MLESHLGKSAFSDPHFGKSAFCDPHFGNMDLHFVYMGCARQVTHKDITLWFQPFDPQTLLEGSTDRGQFLDRQNFGNMDVPDFNRDH